MAQTPDPTPTYQTLNLKQGDSAREGSAFVRLRGLPYTAKEDEIIDFFKGIKVGAPPAPVGYFAG